MRHPITEVIQEHKKGSPVGIYSACTANSYAIEAALEQARNDHSIAVIEATSNQVDQYGGYTGMKPEQFVEFVQKLADKVGLERSRIIFGGDHLGPNVWRIKTAEIAMAESKELVRAYVKAGFTKIHLDTSMRISDDPGDSNLPLNEELIVQRAAELAEVAEKASAEIDPANHKPVYVIGTEVPIPGGAQESLSELAVTNVDDVQITIESAKKAFLGRGLSDAWERVIGVVVQPGVEFGDSSIVDYDRSKASALSAFIENSEQLVFEAHSTDYQKEAKLKQLVEDHYAILKVGPWLTYAFREAIFGLASIENDLFIDQKSVILSQIIDVVDSAMLDNPKYWQGHYSGSDDELARAKTYSYSDRIRYYWPNKEVQKSLNRLIENLSDTSIPSELIDKYLPVHETPHNTGSSDPMPIRLIKNRIMEVTGVYARACGLSK